MEHREIIHILHIALLEIRVDAVLIAQEMQRVEGLGLRLRDGRNGRIARQSTEADEVATRVLERDALWCCGRCREVE